MTYAAKTKARSNFNEAYPWFRLFLLILTGLRVSFESNVMATGDNLSLPYYGGAYHSEQQTSSSSNIFSLRKMNNSMIQDTHFSRGICFFVANSLVEDEDYAGISIISGPVTAICTVSVVGKSNGG
jgi:hypothetical protein